MMRLKLYLGVIFLNNLNSKCPCYEIILLVNLFAIFLITLILFHLVFLYYYHFYIKISIVLFEYKFILYIEILLNGCKNITLWSLLYLSSIKDKNLLDLHKSILSVRVYFINFILLKNKILFRFSLIKELLAVIL